MKKLIRFIKILFYATFNPSKEIEIVWDKNHFKGSTVNIFKEKVINNDIRQWTLVEDYGEHPNIGYILLPEGRSNPLKVFWNEIVTITGEGEEINLNYEQVYNIYK